VRAGGEPGAQCAGGGAPTFLSRFLNRVWRFTAAADNYSVSDNTLSVTLGKVNNLPAALADQDDQIVDQDAIVLFDAGTKVYDSDGHRVPREVKYDALLDAADSVLITGKVLRPDKWRKDADDTPVTTIRAKRVKVLG
jgi:hypothetical protein